MTECLGKWIASYYTEAGKAIRGIEECKLAPEYEHFFVEPMQWFQWSDDSRNQHLFAYKKPKDAEEKPGGTGKNKRHATGLPQPQFFSEIPEMNKLDQINE